MLRFDPAHGASRAAHDDGMGARPARPAFHAFEHGTIRHPGGGKHHITFGHVRQSVFPAEIGDAHAPGAFFLFVLAIEEQTARNS